MKIDQIIILNYSLLNWLWWMIGVVIGYFFYYFDLLIYPIYAEEKHPLVRQAKNYWQEKKYSHYFQVMKLNQNLATGLLSRSIFFLYLYFPLAILVLTTSRYMIGKGLVMGLGLHLCLLLFKYKNNVSEFNKIFKSGAGQKLSQKEIDRLVVVFIGLFVIVSLSLFI